MKKKISTMVAISMIATNTMPAINVFADEVLVDKGRKIEKDLRNNITVNPFKLKDYENFGKYNDVYKVNVKSITNNGGMYNQDVITNAIDGKLETHWETGKPNTADFKNEVEFEFDNVEKINRLAYATRQDTAKSKGYPKLAKIFVSDSDESDYKFVGEVESSEITGDMVEFRFDTVEAKRVKFIFDDVHRDWASASEFWFYREDDTMDKLNNLFTDSNMNAVNDEFNSIDKLNKLEEEAKAHPFYKYFSEDIENAKAIVSQEKIEPTIASTTKFEQFTNKDYNKLFKVDKSKIKKISANGKHYAKQVIENAIDDNIDTYWETNASNTSTFNNEVEVEFNESVKLNRVVYGARPDKKGFAEEFEIYGSKTSKGNTYELVSTGKYNKVSGLVEAKFKSNEFRRIKFKFKKSDQNWATLSELLFYSQDEIADKIYDLFTDESKYKLKDEYNDINIINKLEKEIENHPLKDTLIQDLNIAKLIINTSDEELINSSIEVSEIAKSKNLEKYDEKYKISTDNFKSVTNNGGNYGQSVLSKLYDDDKTTHWETGKPNSESFKNEVTFTFKEIQEIEKIIMSSRKDAGQKGFPLEYEIYGSLNENSNEYKLISKGSAKNVTSEDTEIVIPKTKFKKLKFRFVKAYNDMAGLADMSFYKEDTVTRKVNSLFKDKLYTNLSEEYNNIDKINSLEKEINNHPLKEDYIPIINLAKDIVNGNTIEEGQIITLSQRGDENKKRNETRQRFAGGNLDLTGKYVMPDEEFEVYVDADKDGLIPQVVLAQVGEVDGASNHRRTLKIGRNIIKAPSGTKPFAIYLSNRALPEEQSYAPRVRVSGENLNEYPIYIHGKTNIDEYIEQVKNHKGANMTDVMGDRFLISGKNSEAKIAYVDRGKTPLDTVKGFEKVIDTFDKLSGYDENDPNPIHRPSKALYHYKGTNASGLFASNEYIHYDGSTARDLFSGNLGGWGILHEFGHQMENVDMMLGEVTNNLYSIAGQKAFFGKVQRDFTGNQKNIDKYFTFEGTKGFAGFGDEYEFKLGLFERLLVITQITNYFGDEAYTNAFRLIRENPSKYKTGNYQSMITAMSEATGYDLSSHFEYYNYPVTEATKNFTSKFKPFDKKIRYTTIDTHQKIENKVQTFNKETKAIINDVKQEKDGFTLNLSTNDDNKGTIAYEIYRDGKLIALNRTGLYKDNVDSSKEYKYEVIAYDYRANESIKSDEFDTASIIYNPTIVVEDTINIEKNSEFNPLDYVKAVTFDGKEIDKSKIKVLSNVDTKTNGKYEVNYEVEDRGHKDTKTINVVVYENLKVKKSKYGQFENLEKYNEQFKVNVSSITNNGGNYSGSPIGNAIDGNMNTHWETNKPNSNTFKNEVIFDLGESKEISKMAYKGRNGGKGFAKKFEIYTSNESEGNDFILSGKGEYNGNFNDTIEFNIPKTTARRVKFKFIEANQDWASIGEMSFYKEDIVADKINNDLFTDESKTEVSEGYNTLEKLEVLREEAKNHLGFKFFEEDLNKAEELIRAKYPTLNVEELTYIKKGSDFDLMNGITATDKEDGNLTSSVKVNDENFNINRSGEYTLIYSVTDSDNNTTIKERQVIVYDENTYLSDLEWESAVSSWKPVNKDSAVNTTEKIKLNVDGQIKEFDKGFGTAENSEIVYDLDGKYNYFTTYVGTDKNYNHDKTSIRFKVFADGKEVYTSDIIKKDSKAEFINLNVNGVKELKLVSDNVDNNGLGDFASWGDTKLYSINNLDTSELEKIIKEAESLDLINYSQESIETLEKEIIKAKEVLENGNQEEINNSIDSVKNAINSLVEADLNEVVNINDKYLKKSIQDELNKTGDITLGDMRSLTKLSLSGVENLSGIEYAINLESLSMDYNEVRDLRPLAKLKKLKNLSANQQFIAAGQLNISNNKVVADSKVYNINGQNVAKTVKLVDKFGATIIEKDATDEFVIDTTDLKQGTYGVHVLFEDENFDGVVFYIFNVN